MMMQARLLPILALLLFAAPAHAAFKGCYARAYDAAHIAKHAGQTVTSIAFQIGLEGVNSSEDDQNILEVRFSTSKELWLNGFVCVDRGKDMHCKIVDGGNDQKLGGSFVLTAKGDSLLLTPEDDLKLVTEGEFKPGILPVANNSEHKLFKLPKVSDSNCDFSKL